MKCKLVSFFVILLMGFFALQIAEAQGTTYLSNLGQTSDGILPVASDSWLAGDFRTGNNANGYLFNSVQLAMADASGSPSGFTVMLYAPFLIPSSGYVPGNSLGSLSGSVDPSAAGLYAYSPTDNLTLLPNTYYFVVLTSSTSMANGAYESSFTHTSIYNPGDPWVLSISLDSSQGSNWGFLSGTFSQFAITATPIPEPSAETLLGLGGILLSGLRALESKGNLMQKLIVNAYSVCTIGLLAPQITQAQGATYLSNLGQASVGSVAVESNSWLVADIITGNNAVDIFSTLLNWR